MQVACHTAGLALLFIACPCQPAFDGWWPATALVEKLPMAVGMGIFTHLGWSFYGYWCHLIAMKHQRAMVGDAHPTIVDGGYYYLSCRLLVSVCIV